VGRETGDVERQRAQVRESEEPTRSGSLEYNGIIGEPCAVKGACTVRRGTVGKGPPRYYEATRGAVPGKSEKQSTSLAVYSTREERPKEVRPRQDYADLANFLMKNIGSLLTMP
jgi:hypothetical protein